MVRLALVSPLLILAACDCAGRSMVLEGTVIAAATPRVWLCGSEPEERHPEEVARCVEGAVEQDGEAWAYRLSHHPGPGARVCFDPRWAVFESEGCERAVEDVAWVIQATLDVTLDCD